jgi:energy-coupling factor transport system permease protein
VIAAVYRRRASPLHTAGAGAGALYCAAIALVAVLFTHPLVLVACLGAVAVAAVGARVGREVLRAARFGILLAVTLALINPIVTSSGATVLVRGDVVLGHRYDITLEAAVFGAVHGVQVLAAILAFALLSVAIDPDELLRRFRRVGYRSALTAALATRFVPVLARDASRMRDAARCRFDPPGRWAIVRAAIGGALDRAVDVAAALELRGYARPPVGRMRFERRPRSRHDVRVAASAALLVGVAVAAKLAGVAWFKPYPRLSMALGPEELGLAVAVVLIASLPFTGAAARLGVARA